MSKNTGETLFDKVGRDVIAKAIEEFYKKVLSDSEVKHFYEELDIQKQINRQRAFLIHLFGGPTKYAGKDVDLIPTGFVEKGINDSQIEIITNHFSESFKELDVKQKVVNEIMILVDTNNKSPDNIIDSNDLEIEKEKVVEKIIEPKEIPVQKTEPKVNTENEIKLKNMDSNTEKIISELELEIKNLTNERKIDLVRNNVVDKACIVSMTDKKGIITYVNDLFCEVAGYTREECIGQNQNMVRHPNMPKAAFKDLWATIGRGNVWRGDVENMCKDGSSYFVDALISPIIGDNGKPEGYIGIRYEKTEQVLALREAEALQSAVNAGWASIEFNPEGNVIKANNNFLQGLGYMQENEILGKHHQIFCTSEYTSSTAYREFWQALNNGEVQSGEIKRVKKDGTEVWLNASYSPITNAQGVVYKVIKIATDISAVKFPILEVSSILEAMAQGDLTKVITLQSTGYVHEMATSLSTATKNLNLILSDITEVANLVASSSEELLTKSDQMQGTTQEVASAIQQMAEGAQMQASQTDEVSKSMEGVLKSANDMGDKADLINKAAEEGQKSSNEGLNIVQKVVKNMVEIQESADSTSESIDVLNERSEEIARTLNVITDIAAQTNLLALNAAIEAARAGDAGRGFAVVAEEIRKLAEDSRSSAVEIQKVITAVQKDITTAGKAIDTMGVSVKNGNEASNEAEVVFTVIERSTSESLTLSIDIQSATSVQKIGINGTVKNVEQIVVVSEETAAGTEQIATSSKELSQGMEEVSSTSQQLADVANQLQSGLDKFTLAK